MPYYGEKLLNPSAMHFYKDEVKLEKFQNLYRIFRF